jgi:peptide/nickel transport system substrate-binding protein
MVRYKCGAMVCILGPTGKRLSRRALLHLVLSSVPVGLLAAACSNAPAAAPTQAPAQRGATSAAGQPTSAPTAAQVSQPTATPAGQAISRGGTLRAVVQNDFVTMWPAVTTGPSAARCFDWLVRWRRGSDNRWGPQPGLAESWELGDTSAVFKLRRGVKFHDGSGVNAEAVRWNVESWIKNPKSLARTNLGGVAVDKPAEVVDDYTVRINLTGSFGSLLSAVSDATETTGIASPTAYQQLGEDGIRQRAVGSGPFTFVAWQSGGQLSLKRNPNYWEVGADGQPLPYLEEIVYRFVPDDSVRVAEMRSTSADITDLMRGRDVPAVKADPNLTYIEDPGNGNRYRFFFNGKQGPFKANQKLRQAVHYAIDRDAIARALGGGIGIPQRYDLTQAALGYDESVPYYSFDLDQARDLFAASGAPSGLQVRLTVIAREADQQQAQLIQQMLDKIGIKVSIEALERVAWGVKVRQQNDFDLATQRAGTSVDPDPLFTLAWADEGPAAYVRADEPDIQACIVEGRSSYVPATRQQTYQRCQRLMFDAAWWGFLWLQPWNYVLNKRVRGNAPMWLSNNWREEVLWLAK